jgi:hypothetical protein
MAVSGNRNRRLAIIFTSVGILIGIATTLTITTLSSPKPAPAAEVCTRDNNCLIVPLNDSSYQLKGESYKAYESCLTGTERCTWVTTNNTNYILKGEAYDANVELDNLIVPFHRMKLVSQLMDEVRRELIAIDGRDALQVDLLIEKYNITEATSNIVSATDAENQPTGKSAKSVYGYIYKNDLIRFTNEHDPESLKAISVYSIASVASVNSDAGTFDTEFVPNAEQNKHIVEEYKKIKEKELARILNEREGVIRVSDQDFILLK